LLRKVWGTMRQQNKNEDGVLYKKVLRVSALTVVSQVFKEVSFGSLLERKLGFSCSVEKIQT